MCTDQGKTPSSQPKGPGPAACSLVIPNINTQEALARFAGDEERYRHWLSEFISFGPAAARQIRQALANDSREEATKLAHALKGRTGMLGMTELFSISRTLEMALRNNEPALLWLEELERTVEEMSTELSSVLVKSVPEDKQ